MRIGELERILLYAADLDTAKRFYAGLLGIAVLGTGGGRIVLHRNDKGHDERGIFPVGNGAAGAALRFSVDDPDAWEEEITQKGFPVAWKAQEASWGRFVVVGDPDGRPVVLAKMIHRGGMKPQHSVIQRL